MTVESLGKHTNQARFMSVEDTLKDALAQISEGGDLEGFRKCIVIGLKDEEFYTIDWRQCGMKMSEVLALLEVTKAHILNHLGYNQLPGDYD